MFYLIQRLIRKSFQSKKSGPIIAFAVLNLSILVNSIIFMVAEDQSFGDSIWYSYITVTTIGYGDFYPATTIARVANFLFLGLGGLGTFSYILGWGLDKISTTAANRRLGLTNVFAKDHILIVNFNELDVRQIITEVRSDPQYADVEIVIISDKIESLPFTIENVEFVSGSPIEEETYERAQIQHAKHAFILATNTNDPASDCFNAAIVGVIERMNRDVNTIAECLQNKHRHFFEAGHVDSVVCAKQIGINLMVQELQDHGVSAVFETITSNNKKKGDTLFSATIKHSAISCTYNDLAHAFVDRDGNMISVKKNGDNDNILTNFSVENVIEKGDEIVFTAAQRYTGDQLLKFAKDHEGQRKAISALKAVV